MALTKGCRHEGSLLSTLLGHDGRVIAQSRACHRAMLGCLRAHRNRVVENARAARDGSLVGRVATTRLLTSPSPGRDAVRIHGRVRTTCVGKNTDISGVSWVSGRHVRGLLPSWSKLRHRRWCAAYYLILPNLYYLLIELSAHIKFNFWSITWVKPIL